MESVATRSAQQPVNSIATRLSDDILAEFTSAYTPPSKPPLVVRIGVTGHRPNGLPQDLERLRQVIRAALEELGGIAIGILAKRGEASFEIYSDETTTPILRLISPLAEGSDRLVAEEALKLGSYELQSPLPFAIEKYEQDFGTEESKKLFHDLLHQASSVLQLDGSREAENEAYEAVGRLVLRQCDLLIAIWDGMPQAGVGGTGQIVREALSLEIPTLWISPKDPHETSLLISTEPLKSIGDYHAHLEKRLREMFLFKIDGQSKEEEKARQERGIKAAERFFSSDSRRAYFGFVYSWFREIWCIQLKELKEKIFGGRTKQAADSGERHWQDFLTSNPRYRERIDRNYAWADSLANYYGGMYRSSYVLIYAMGAFAVLFAFLGFHAEGTSVHYLWFGMEFLLIIMISAITWRGRKSDWHERWMDYRLIAESLRQIQFLAPLGRVTLSFKVPAHLKPSDPRNSWFNWYYRALVRDFGMFGAEFDESYLQSCRKALKVSISGQRTYHHKNHVKLKLLARRLHKFEQGLFGLAGFACVLHFIPARWLHEAIPFTLSVFTIVLPAFGASLSAISHHGDFERLALRSEALEERLSDLLLKELPAENSLASRELGRSAEIFSEIMFQELLDWRFAFLEKQIEFPA